MSMAAFKNNVTSFADNAMRYARQGAYILGAVAGSYAMSGCDKDSSGSVEPKDPEVTLPAKIENSVTLKASYSNLNYWSADNARYSTTGASSSTVDGITFDSEISNGTRPNVLKLEFIKESIDLKAKNQFGGIVYQDLEGGPVLMKISSPSDGPIAYTNDAQIKEFIVSAEKYVHYFEGENPGNAENIADQFVSNIQYVKPAYLNAKVNGQSVNLIK